MLYKFINLIQGTSRSLILKYKMLTCPQKERKKENPAASVFEEGVEGVRKVSPVSSPIGNLVQENVNDRDQVMS